MNSKWFFALVLALGVSAGATGAADWAQWRGPKRDGISLEKGLLKAWPKEGPRLLWQAKDLGSGYSTPAVVGDRLFVQSNRNLEDELVQALSVRDGKMLWEVRIGKVGNPNQQPAYPGTRSTPTVDGNLVYALGSDGDLACLEAASGKVRWLKNVRAEFGGRPGIWAYSESPLVDGAAVVCTPGGPDAALVALNKRTGALLWKSAVPGADMAGYASIIAADVAGQKQYIQFMSGGVVGVNARDGRFLWRYNQTAQNSPANIPTPIYHDGQVYTSSGRGGGALVRLTTQDGAVQVEPVYFANRLPNSIGGAVLLGNHLYGTGGAGLMCVEFATGKVLWQERGIGAGAVCFADERLYLHGENGEVALIEPAIEDYREVGRFSPPEPPQRGGGSRAWAYPVVANGRLYIRESGALWCYDLRARAE